MRLYKFIGERYLYESLLFKRLKVSKPSEVNDPFEFCPFSFTSRLERHTWKKAMQGPESEAGFISFSKSWESPSLWGNYADNHRGACLEFEVPVEMNNPRGCDEALIQVNYTEEMRAFNSEALRDPSIIAKELRHAVSTKSSHWAYEEEWRLLVDLGETTASGSHRFKPFSEKMQLKRIILGFRSSLSSEEARIAYGNDFALPIDTARPAFSSYKMTKQLSESLQK